MPLEDPRISAVLPTSFLVIPLLPCSNEVALKLIFEVQHWPSDVEGHALYQIAILYHLLRVLLRQMEEVGVVHLLEV